MSTWDDRNFSEMFSNTPNSQVVAGFLDGSDHKDTTSIRDLTDAGRAARAISVSIEAGTRVSFVTNIGSLLAYPNPPKEGMKGTVVKVRTSAGDATFYEGRVFVKWDDGNFMPTCCEHLRMAAEKIDQHFREGCTRTYDRFIVASLGILGDEFLRHAGSDSDLVHKATKDLWSMTKNEGGFTIERLFDDNGQPLKA